MLLKKNNFYVFKYDGDGTLKGFDENGEPVKERPTEIVMFWNRDDMETKKKFRIATQHEKEYWLDSMNIIDSDSIKGEVGAVSLCDFDEWMVKKGYAQDPNPNNYPEDDLDPEVVLADMFGGIDYLHNFLFETFKSLISDKGNIINNIQIASEKYAKGQKHSNHTEKLVCAADFRVGALWLLTEIEKKIKNDNNSRIQ
jgi:hypothetical protein